MKKNLLSIIILALIIVNIVVSVMTMLSVSSASQKTAALVADIATVLDLEINGVEKTDITEGVSLANTAVYSIADLTIPLKTDSDGTAHYAVGTVTLSMDTTHEDYATYSETISDYEGIIDDIIFDVMAQYTLDEAKENGDLIKSQMLEQIQTKFGSTFIYEVYFNFLYS